MNVSAPKIEMLPVAALRPYAGNARTHSRKQVRQIADSIKRFGFTNPVLIATKTRSSPAMTGCGRQMSWGSRRSRS